RPRADHRRGARGPRRPLHRAGAARRGLPPRPGARDRGRAGRSGPRAPAGAVAGRDPGRPRPPPGPADGAGRRAHPGPGSLLRGGRELQSPPMRTIARALRWRARRHPELAATWFQGRTRTFAELDASTSELAGGLVRDLGVRPGDRVAILDKNSDEYLELLFA